MAPYCPPDGAWPGDGDTSARSALRPFTVDSSTQGWPHSQPYTLVHAGFLCLEGPPHSLLPHLPSELSSVLKSQHVPFDLATPILGVQPSDNTHS